MSTRLAPLQPASQQPQRSACASCGRQLSLVYYYLPGRKERYCPACIAQRPRCDSCAAPVGDDGWRLHDGRVLCRRCHATAVYDPAVAQEIFEHALEQLARHPGIELRIGAAFRLVDRPTLQDLAREGGLAPGEHEHTLGLYQNFGRVRVIYALYGLPRLLMRVVIAHELAHAWQGENCPLLRDQVWREGFAEWVAYQHLLHIGAGKAAERMLQSPHPYRPGLERCLELERQVGRAGLLERMRRME